MNWNRILFVLLFSLVYSIPLVVSESGSGGTGLWGWTSKIIPKLSFLSKRKENEDIPPPPPAPKEKPDYLYSTPDTQRLARVEEHVYEAMKTYVSEMEERLDLMRRYMEDYETSSVNMMEDASQEKKDYIVIANPLVTHRMMQRFAVDYVGILKHLQEKRPELDFLVALKTANPDAIPFPDVQQDYNQSLYSLFRIQKYSDLATKDIIEGRLGPLETNITLSSRYAHDLGVYMTQTMKNPALAPGIEYLEAALEKLEEEEQESGEEDEDFKNQIERDLEAAAKFHDQVCSSPHWTIGMETCFSYLIQEEFGRNKPTDEEEKYKREWAAKDEQERAKLHRNEYNYSIHVKRNFISVCSGEDLRDEAEKSRLYCWYERKKAPYLAIAPLKFELLSDFPPLYQIYEILTPSGMEKLINKSLPTLEKSMVINTEDPNKNDYSEVRTSSQTWLYETTEEEELTKFLLGLAKQVEYATGLTVVNNDPARSSEAWQVATYRPSHHYDEHIDALADERRTADDGDRIATFMFYLNDVDVGGYTGFPAAGIAAKPVAGSAVFWHNLKRNGKEDKRTWHGGCPVIHGVKWVANKWILYYESWTKKPCTLDPEDYHRH